MLVKRLQHFLWRYGTETGIPIKQMALETFLAPGDAEPGGRRCAVVPSRRAPAGESNHELVIPGHESTVGRESLPVLPSLSRRPQVLLLILNLDEGPCLQSSSYHDDQQTRLWFGTKDDQTARSRPEPT